jgi:SAM-dependent methyltransferase
VGDAEFSLQASAIADVVEGWPLDLRIAAACRGSGNPAALAWIAESIGLTARSLVVDVGGGIGGPAAWVADRFGSRLVALDPSWPAPRDARHLFGLPTICAGADALPLRADAFDAALLLEVLSVVDDPSAALAEARRVGARLGVLDHCSTTGRTVEAGGSRFRTPEALAALVADAGWDVDELTEIGVTAPARWSTAADEAERSASGSAGEAEPSENEVVSAIESGRLRLWALAARR